MLRLPSSFSGATPARTPPGLAPCSRSAVYLKVDEDAAADAWIRRLNGGGRRSPTILIDDPDRPDIILREPSDEELLAALGFA